MITAYVKVISSYIRINIIRFMSGKGVEFNAIQSFSLFCKINIQKGAKIKFDSNVQITSGCNVFVASNAALKIGEKTYFNERCMLSTQDNISIGKNCLFGPDVKIYDNNHIFQTGVGVVHGKHKTKPIKIGDNCWVASNVVILPGVEIGNNCVIGAGVILKGIIPDNSLVHSNSQNVIEPIK